MVKDVYTKVGPGMNLAQMTKRDLKAPSITAYYHKLASNIPDDVEDRTSLVESYMKYIDYLVKEQEKELHKWKRRSYNKSYNRKFK